MLQTSYFPKTKFVPNPLSIASKSPSWYLDMTFNLLTPKKDYLFAYKNKEIDPEEYTRQYMDTVLDTLDPAQIYQHLTKTNTVPCTLLCYETPGDFCHRRIVAAWFEYQLGIFVPEFGVEKDKLFQIPIEWIS